LNWCFVADSNLCEKAETELRTEAKKGELKWKHCDADEEKALALTHSRAKESSENAKAATEALEKVAALQDAEQAEANKAQEAAQALSAEAERISAVHEKVQKQHLEKTLELGNAVEGEELTTGSANAAALREHELSKKWVQADSAKADAEQVEMETETRAANGVAWAMKVAKSVKRQRLLCERAVALVEEVTKKEESAHAEYDVEKAHMEVHQKAFDKSEDDHKQSMLLKARAEQVMNKSTSMKEAAKRTLKAAAEAKKAALAEAHSAALASSDANEMLIGANMAAKDAEEAMQTMSSVYGLSGSMTGLVQNDGAVDTTSRHHRHHQAIHRHGM